MFGIGLPEFILIMALALIVVGPDKLPGLAKTVAKQVLELKKAANSLKDSLQDELAEEKESLKELTAGLEDIDVSLGDLNSTKNLDEGDFSRPDAVIDADTDTEEENLARPDAPIEVDGEEGGAEGTAETVTIDDEQPVVVVGPDEENTVSEA